MFGFDGKVKGIYVNNLGIIPRAQYETEGFDPEMALIEKVGIEHYNKNVASVASGREPRER